MKYFPPTSVRMATDKALSVIASFKISTSAETPDNHHRLRQCFHTFEENQPRYKICCNRVHTWRMARLVCAVELLGTIAMVITLITSFFVDIFDFPVSTKELLIAWCVVGVLTSGLYAFGMKTLKAPFMIPRLVVQLISMVIDVMLIGYTSSLMVNEGQFNADQVTPDDDYTVENRVFLMCWIIITILQLFFFVMLFMAYRFVRDWTVYMTYR